MKNTFYANESYKVEGFNVEDFIQKYEGTDIPFLPLRVQLVWFRRVFPNGKIRTTEPVWAPDKTTGTFSSTAYIYKDAKDGLDDYIACASCKRTTAEDGDFDGYETAQSAAISNALERAGFMAPMTEEELKMIVRTPGINLPPEKPEAEETPTGSQKDVSETEETGTDAEPTAPDADTAEETVETPEPENSPKPKETENTETPVDSVPSENGESEDASAAPITTENSETFEIDEDAEDAVLGQEDPVKEEEPVKGTSEEDDADHGDEPEPTEEPEHEEAGSPKEGLSDRAKSELEEARQVFVDYHNYSCAMGELESRIVEEVKNGDNSSRDFILWLSTSRVVTKRAPQYQDAASKIVAVHPEWTSDI